MLISFLPSCSDMPVYGDLQISRNDLPEVGNTISITSWNVGYAALGAKADFLSDGGENLRALDQATISAAADAITMLASRFNTQFVFFQELAKAGFITRSVPLLSRMNNSLSDYSSVFWQDLGISNVPEQFAVSHGLGVYARNDVEISRAYKIPQEPGFYFLFVKRYYAAIVNEVPIDGSDKKWILINIHLSAFDDETDVRRKQLRAVFDFAGREFDKGNYVVIGGDWNLRLVETEFVHNTDDEYLFWINDFPKELLPVGWRLAIDDSVPTVRTLHAPYNQGQNYTTIVDGFAYSPNVAVNRVSTYDLGFEHTDHHPVSAVFRIRY